MRNNPVNYYDPDGLFRIYSHRKKLIGHVGLSTYGSLGELSWDFGRYGEMNPGWFNERNPIGSGPNVLFRQEGAT